MSYRVLLLTLILGLASVGISRSQNSGVPAMNGMQEFPVILQQSVTAGKTPVGTKVQARLLIATLVEGKVIPRNAILSGEVIESAPKSRTEPSKLSIRMDSVSWKEGTAAIKLYVTSWYYPSIAESGQNLRYGPDQGPTRTWNGAGAYPDPNSPAYKPFPEGESDKTQTVPDTPNSVTSKHRVLMKGVDIEHGKGDDLVLVSKRSNLKLDRFTAYVIAAGDLLAKK